MPPAPSSPHERFVASAALRIAFACSATLVPTVLACGRRASVESEGPESRRPARGDSVVVEQTAAEFFEARVLGVTGDQLRVEVSGKTGSVRVALGDVYRLPPAPHRFSVGELAICNSARHVWVPCRIVRSGAVLAVHDADEHELELGPSAVLAPTAVTELNIQRQLARSQARAAFAASATSAGSPQPPHGWHPAPRERVLARDGAAWFSARVHELREHSIAVVWDSDRQMSDVDPSAMVPQPPYDVVLQRGMFALLRPASPSQPWKPVRVRRAEGTDIVVEDVDGAETRAGARDLVPLGFDAGAPPVPK